VHQIFESHPYSQLPVRLPSPSALIANSLRMASWDPSTIASVTALIVAVMAIIIALAQTLQQYFVTGQLIRICDSVVFGPMPGQGRRVWQPSQFRFRVLYSIPQISLSTDLWPSRSGIVKSYAIGRHPLPPLAGADGEVPGPPSIVVKMVRRRGWKAKAWAFLMGLTPWRDESSIESSIVSSVESSVGESVGESVEDAIEDSVQDSVEDSVEEEEYGNMQVSTGHPEVVPTSKL
jgi:hypothetical protein